MNIRNTSVYTDTYEFLVLAVYLVDEKRVFWGIYGTSVNVTLPLCLSVQLSADLPMAFQLYTFLFICLSV